MQHHVIGVKRIEGISSEAKGSNPFDMCRLYALVAIEQSDGKRVKVVGYGLEVGEMDLDPAALPEFAKISLPAKLDLKTEQVFRMGEFRTVVVGFEPVKAAVKVA